MRNYIFLLITIMFLFIGGCDNSITEADNKNSFYEGTIFFNGTTDGNSWLGGGVAFYNKDSSLHIRGIYGGLSQYNQIDILVDNFELETSLIDSGKAGMSVIFGGDSVGRTFSSQGQQSDSLNYFWNKKEGYISGTFRFIGLSLDSISKSLAGNFKIQIAKSGTNWVIDYDENGNISCSFIN